VSSAPPAAAPADASAATLAAEGPTGLVPVQPGIGGLTFHVGGVRRVIGDPGWARVLRRFSRIAVWMLPFSAGCIALSGMWGWPKPVPSHSAWQALWLVMNLVGLLLAIVGVIGLSALFAATTARRWAFTALVTMLGGSLFLAPVLGLIAVARPAVANVAGHIGADSAANLEDRFFRSPFGLWLAVAGLLLIGVGWISLGLAVLSCRVLNRTDGFLLMIAVALAVAGAYLSWQFLLVIGSLVALAAGMDLSWSAAQLRPDGSQPDDGH
jgi:hypothetical protein